MHKYFYFSRRYLALLFFMVSACAATPQSSAHAQSECDGQIYQSGIASVYGDNWQNAKTASSEKLSQNDFTAAHPKLPFGTMVEITDKKTGAKTVVRINDRGPFVKKRIIDVAPAARRALGWDKTGLYNVSLRLCQLAMP